MRTCRDASESAVERRQNRLTTGLFLVWSHILQAALAWHHGVMESRLRCRLILCIAKSRWTRIGCLQGCGTTRCQCINSTLVLRLWNAARLSGPCKRVVPSLAAPGCHRDAAPFLCRCAVAPLSSANARKSSTKIRDHCGDVGEEQTGGSMPTGHLQAC